MAITKADILGMDWKAVAAALRDPKTQPAVIHFMKEDREVSAHVNKLSLERQQVLEEKEEAVDRATALNNPPTTEELAAEAAAVAAEAESVEPIAVVKPAEQVPAATVTPAPAKPTKIIREYQVKDEDGNPIGRPTHLEANSMEEMLEKMQVAHENATRAFHRLKKQNITFKQKEATTLTPEQIKAAAAKALEAKDAEEAQKLVRSVLDSEYKQKDEDLKKRLSEAEQQAQFLEGQRIANVFTRRHMNDFVPVQANFQVLVDYIQQHDMDFTLDNLEAAFTDISQTQPDKLAPLPARASKPAEVAPNPAPTATVAQAADSTPVASAPATVTTTEVPAQPVAEAPPVVEATVPTPVAANQPTPTRRPGVNGGIPPGTLSAKRAVVADPAAERREFMTALRAMKPEEMRAKLKGDPQFVKKLQTYGIKVS